MIVVALLHVAAGGGSPKDPGEAYTAYSRAVTKICAGALLFDGRHAIGTRTGALAVARDIRASNRRRLDRVEAVPVPLGWERPAGRWLSLERRLAEAYADSWVRIFDVIEATHTPSQHAREPQLLERLVHAPDELRRRAAQLALALHLPDCTGGGLGSVPRGAAP